MIWRPCKLGAVVLLAIGLQFVFRGPTAIELLRGESEHLAGAMAMPVLIGQSACVECPRMAASSVSEASVLHR